MQPASQPAIQLASRVKWEWDGICGLPFSVRVRVRVFPGPWDGMGSGPLDLGLVTGTFPFIFIFIFTLSLESWRAAVYREGGRWDDIVHIDMGEVFCRTTFVPV